MLDGDTLLATMNTGSFTRSSAEIGLAMSPKTLDDTDSTQIPTFTPMKWTMQDIRDAIPTECFERSTSLSIFYLIRDLVMASFAAMIITRTDSCVGQFAEITTNSSAGYVAVRVAWCVIWMTYWWFQGLIFTGIWVIGHECGHGAFSPNRMLCDVVGFILHSFLWTPYFSWRISHHRHHSNHNSMESDEVYVPKTRSDLGIPKGIPQEIRWHECFEDTPIYTFLMLVRQQLLAFPAYLLINVSGQKRYPRPTSHFDPNAIIFKKNQRHLVILSNIGLAITGTFLWVACHRWGGGTVLKIYGIPWLLVTHWFIMITYLHHTDPIIPHYRAKSWSFTRGAAGTVDRDLLGWQGRFFLHDVARYHVVHHFFPTMAHYHGAKATGHLKAFLGDQYHYSAKPVFRALWDNYNRCQFVEDEGDILFYRDRQGRAAMMAARDSH